MDKETTRETISHDERWQHRYEMLILFIAKNKRRPSKYKDDERLLWDWFRRQRKLLAKDELAPDRAAKLKPILSLDNRFRRKNQFK